MTQPSQSSLFRFSNSARSGTILGSARYRFLLPIRLLVAYRFLFSVIYLLFTIHWDLAVDLSNQNSLLFEFHSFAFISPNQIHRQFPFFLNIKPTLIIGRSPIDKLFFFSFLHLRLRALRHMSPVDTYMYEI